MLLTGFYPNLVVSRPFGTLKQYKSDLGLRLLIQD